MAFWRYLAALIVVLVALVGGTWIVVKATTDHLLYGHATRTAQLWANFLADNVADLNEIAAGEAPSSASLAFFGTARTAGLVFRYTIFNRYGFSMLVADRDKVTPVDLSEFDAKAADAVKHDTAVVDAMAGSRPGEPAYFAQAYVPVLVGGKPIAVVAAYVDQTGERESYFQAFLVAAASLCVLTALSFSVPAIAWYRRTREKQQADRRIRFLAHHDSLTGLANRARLMERLETALAESASTGALVAVHMIDIDHFKQVNDSLGHDVGDALLGVIGKRLRMTTRIEDMVARFGGDEFVVVQTGLVSATQAEEFAKRTIAGLKAPMHIKGQELTMTCTVGIAMGPADGKSAARLIKSADLALYAAKAAGRNCARFFTSEMDVALQERMALEKLIRDAATHNDFVLHYQPVFEIVGRRLVGFEALLRLPTADGTLIPPATIIPIAEEIRLIDKIGAWVLREACRTAKSWPSDLTVAVNLSSSQFESGSVEPAVAEALNESGLDPHRLELEITEGLLLNHTHATLETLRRLKDKGVSIVMDDFGTGYSSLSYLWKFPFDKIKIDRSFMESFAQSGHNVETVVKTIIALGREMNMRVTVEGVETAEQVDFLYDANADQVQGYFFGKPVSAARVEAAMLDDRRSTSPETPLPEPVTKPSSN
ncbi:putative bifunctional diguanylate cyclase/phosphodiesterase [Undibacter mobilis]|nr:EAL domain-containing protein [Undibacter mobilis]